MSLTDAAAAPSTEAAAEPRGSILKLTEVAKWFAIRDVWKRRVGWLKALDGVSLDVRKGEILGVVGESGCGKSTLGKTVMGIHRPTSGSIVFEGAEIGDVGPAFAGSAAFANGTNVQVARRVAADRIEIDIWERGVGPTTASGSSSCAAAVAAVRSGRVEPGRIDVVMAGGHLQVTVSGDLDVGLRGPVQVVARGRLDPGFARGLGP